MKRPRRRWVVATLAGGLAAGGLAATVSLTAGADSQTGQPGYGPSNLPGLISQRLSQFSYPHLGQVSAWNDEIATGDSMMSYQVNGQTLVQVRDSASNPGQSCGIAQITQPSPGVYQVSGVASMGAQSLSIVLRNGTTVQPPLVFPGNGAYPFFNVEVSSPPVQFQTTGSAPPGCTAAGAGWFGGGR